MLVRDNCFRVLNNNPSLTRFNVARFGAFTTRCVSFEVAHFQARRADTKADVSALQA